MALLALEPVAPVDSIPPAESEAPGLPHVLDAFAEVIEAIDSDASVDEILHLVARKICLLVDCSRCGVYLKHSDADQFRGQVIEPCAPGADERIRRLICGTPADRLTQEILATQQPVLVRNAQQDPRAVRSIMQSWGVRSILGVPMIVRGDVVGMLFLDNEQTPHPFSADNQAVASTFARLAGIAIQQAQRAAELRTNLRAVAKQNEILRQSTAIDERLTTLVLDGGTLADVATAVSDLTGKPCAIHDDGFRPLALGGARGPDSPAVNVLDAERRRIPVVAEALAGLKPNRPVVIGPVPSAGLLHRFLVTAVVLDGKTWGYLALMEVGSRLTAVDAAALRHSATAVAFELSVERRVAVADGHARQALVRDLVNGLEDQTSVVRRAEAQGFRIGAPHVVALLAPEGDGGPLCADELAAGREAGGQPRPMWAASVPHGALAVIVELDESVSRPAALAAVKDVVGRLRSGLGRAGTTLAALSSPCRTPGDYSAAFEEARQVLRCLSGLRGTDDGALTMLAADDLGAGRLMLNMVGGAEADRFAQNAIGPLIASGTRTIEELLSTVRVFFDRGRSVRNSAKFLGVHENTIRYRLGRVLDLTGLDLAADADAQLTAQVALLILRIQGRLPALTLPPS